MPPIQLTEQNDGQLVDVHLGQEVHVSLPEIAGTGYRWAVDRVDDTLLEVQGARPQYSSVLPGASGRAMWIIVPKQVGSAELTLKQWRPWEGDASIVGRYGVRFRILP